MMESLGLRCGKSISLIEERSRSYFPSSSPIHYQSLPNKRNYITRSCLVQNLHNNNNNKGITTTTSPSSIPFSIFNNIDDQHPHHNHNKNHNPISPDKLDQWIQDSVSEIVRNIGEAPFLVHVYSQKTTKEEKEKLELEREKAVENSWSAIRRRWKEGCPIPDGVILVEQLDKAKKIELLVDENGGEEEEEEEDPTTAGTGTTAWGVLIQGRGVDTAACYILKTCRVMSALGFCTHFCLLRAKCFGESAELQLQNSWNGVSSN